MIYTGIGEDLAKIDYREDPLAKTIAPNYQKLSMSAWGMPELNDLQQFNPEMEKNIDTVPDQFNQYVQGLNDLKSKVQGLMKTGVDITKPSLDPQVNAAHLEFLQKFNNITALGKQLQQSREIRKAIETAGTKDVYTNPVPNEILTSSEKYVNRPDLQQLNSLVSSRGKNREYFYSQGDLQSANGEIDNALLAIDQWEAQAPKGFEAQYKRDADLARAQIKTPYYDKYKNDKLAFDREKEANKNTWKGRELALKKDYMDFRKSQSLPTEFDTYSLIEDAGNGNQQAIGLIKNYYEYNDKGESNGTYFDVVNGNEILSGKQLNITDADGNPIVIKQEKLKQPDNTVINVLPNQKYFVHVRKDGSKFVTPVSSNTINVLAQGLIGKSAEAGVSRNKTSNLYQDDDIIESDVPITSKKVSSNSFTTSKKTTQNNQTTTTKKKISW